MSARVDKTHPKSFAFIMEAIDEVAPGQGEQVYWRAFERFEEYARRGKPRRRELRASMPPKEGEWTVDVLAKEPPASS